MTSESNLDEVSLISALTLVLWAGVFTVGVAGLRMKYPHPTAAAALLSPVQTRILEVDAKPRVPSAARASESPAPAESPSAVPLPPQAPQFAPPDDPPPLSALATVNPFVAPKARPIAHVASVPPASQPASEEIAVQELTLGSGAGIRIQPEYPIEAQLAGQRGTVVVRFFVAEDGTINNAKAIEPCRWPLLDQAALRAVRDAYFPAGPRGLCQVTITFQ